MTAPVTVGIVGVGIIAEVHLAVLAERPDVTVAFAVDPDPARSATFRDRPVPHYARLGDALAGHDPDLVVVASPTPTHVELAHTVLTGSRARVLVEKPLTHDLDALATLRALPHGLDARSRLSVAHHFAFSPEVRWAAEQIARHPEWGPVTRATAAFHDPYILRAEQAFASYVSSWMDSGANQLSMISRFVDLDAVAAAHQSDGGASSWATVRFRSGETRGTARLRTSWMTGASSKRTTIDLGESGVEIWLDHTAMTAFAARDDTLLAIRDDDGTTPRKIAHYRPLYESLLTDTPDPVMSLDTAAKVTELLHRGVSTTTGG